LSHFAERLVELRRHLEHLRALRPKIETATQLRRDLSLHNDLMFSLLTVCQLVIDLAGELCVRNGLRFESYAEAVRNLSSLEEFPESLVAQLARLPGFRNIIIHEYVALDLDRAVEALNDLQPVEEFAEIVRELEWRRLNPEVPGT
jgi:uncharacterized protein YutE (UPF0331/DUF86 family)